MPKPSVKRLAPVRGVVLQSETRIQAAPAAVWRALTTGLRRWWPKNMTVNPKALGVTLEARLGGRFYEDWGGGNGLTWWTVIGLKKGGWLELAGHLEPETGGPGISLARILLRANGKDTELHIVDNLWGPIPRGQEKNIAGGWEALARALKAYMEKR
jgi:uncharacterized protein YndB with AHSA1/START domain